MVIHVLETGRGVYLMGVHEGWTCYGSKSAGRKAKGMNASSKPRRVVLWRHRKMTGLFESLGILQAGVSCISAFQGFNARRFGHSAEDDSGEVRSYSHRLVPLDLYSGDLKWL